MPTREGGHLSLRSARVWGGAQVSSEAANINSPDRLRLERMPAPGSPSDQKRDLAILRISPVCLFHKESVLNDTVHWLEQHDYVVHAFDASRWASAADLHESLKKELAFPDYYGRNLNALDECLGDMDIPAEGRVVLVFRHYDALQRALGSLAQTVLDIIAGASYRHLANGRRLLALVQSDDPAIGFDPVGKRPVIWNSKEFLPQNRGT